MSKTQQTLSGIITEHMSSDRAMVQHFGDRKVRIVTDLTSSVTAIFINDELKLKAKNLSIKEYEALQLHAADVWNSLSN